MVIDGRTIPLTPSGAMENPMAWTLRVAEFLAKREGIQLNADHYRWINEFREAALNGQAETWLTHQHRSRELGRLFPKDLRRHLTLLSGFDPENQE
jgi:sulfur relay (sulfurtransferase) DsrC/TusE family protein